MRPGLQLREILPPRLVPDHPIVLEPTISILPDLIRQVLFGWDILEPERIEPAQKSADRIAVAPSYANLFTLALPTLPRLAWTVTPRLLSRLALCKGAFYTLAILWRESR